MGLLNLTFNSLVTLSIFLDFSLFHFLSEVNGDSLHVLKHPGSDRCVSTLQGHSSGCHHGHSGHSHSHGPRAAAFGGMTNMYMPGYGQMGKGPDPVVDISQQPKKRSQMDESSSWDIVKATQ